MWLIISIIAIFVFAVWGIAEMILAKRKKINRLSQSLAMSLFLVRMPKYDKKEQDQKQDFKALIEQMEQVYSYFLYLKTPSFKEKRWGGYVLPRVVFEIASKVGEADIAFYVAVPDYMEGSVEKGIQGVFPQAFVEKVPQDYTVFEPQAMVAGRKVFLKDRLYFPVKTYKNLERDPLSSITNGLSKIKPEEGAAVQIVLKPSRLDIKKKEESILSNVIEKGWGVRTAMAQANRHWAVAWIFSILEAFFSGGPKKQQEEQERQTREIQKERTANDTMIQAVKAKAQKQIFDVNIRLVGVAGEAGRAEEIADHLAGAFAQFSSTLNSFHPVRVKKKWLKKFVYDFSFRNYNPKEKIVLNLEELSGIYHFPLAPLETPNIKWAKSKESTPPTDLPSDQALGLNLIGKSLYRGEERPVYFTSRDDRRRHFYIVGQTGVGKSNLLREMIRQDIEKGEGVAVIDPNGDLIEDTLANIPKERADDVVLFEPFDMSRPCGLNMLEWKSPEQKDFAISEMIMIFTKLFPPEIIGPMFEHYMRNAMLALMADKSSPGTLVDIPRIFTDKAFMESKVAHVSDPLVQVFWQQEWAQTTGQTRSDMLGYVVSKVGRFVENEMMRNIIGQQRSTFDLEDIMNNKKIFLANLSKGLTGEMNASLLGLILVSKMQIAAFRRGAIPQEERKDFYLYIDEFQNFTTDSIAIILSEARKYRLNLILAHQFMPQLTEQIRNAVIGNVGSIACFRIGALDAEFLEKQFEPEFSRFDLLNIDNFQFVVKMMINNKISSPFKVATMRAKEGNLSIVPLIKQLSKLKYGRSREAVEKDIAERTKLTFD
ncbi:MAG: type IV secretion system DNA-binding domain-containing protein [Candidatus Pacebacteria bacterium]|nr:type IV secretion system DNA-binding domain-containing protein [Candidatus Paceibacterota bacterium]